MKVLVVVFIPSDSKDICGAISQVLAPFDCEKEVEEHEKECGCVGSHARLEAHQYAQKIGGTQQQIDERFERENSASNAQRLTLLRLSEQRPLSNDEAMELDGLMKEFHSAWDGVHEPYNRAYYDALEQHPLLDQPDANCDICGGSGKTVSDFNPHAQWDRWSIGWHNYFDTTPPPEPRPRRAFEPNLFKRLTNWWRDMKDASKEAEKSRQKSESEGEVIAVRDIPSDWPPPYAAVADGQWYQNQESPALPLKERAQAQEDWEATYADLLSRHQDFLAVACRVAV